MLAHLVKQRTFFLHPSLQAIMCAMVALLTVSGVASAEGVSGSELSRLKNGEIIVQEPSNNKDRSVPYVTAKVYIPKSPSKVWSVIQTPENVVRNERKVKSVKVVSSHAGVRDLAFRVQLSRVLPSFAYTLRHQSTSPYVLGFKRLSGSFKDIQGYWQVVPVENNTQTVLVYSLSIDPGALVPRSLLIPAVKSDLPQMMQTVKMSMR